jgi:hypothetical protein
MTEEERLAIEVLVGELDRRGCAGLIDTDEDPYLWLEALHVAGFELRK